MSGVVLITGGARRIGGALARGFAARGFSVAIHCRDSHKDAEALAREITEAGGRAHVCQGDLTEPTYPTALVDEAAGVLGPLTVLVNNASLFEKDSLADLTPEHWDAHMNINLRAPVLLAQAFARQCPENARGLVINLIDQKVLRLTPHFFSYTVSKAALWAATQMLAQALAPRIRVNAIAPGPVLPNRFQTEEEFARICAELPLARGATPEEIAAAALFILDAGAMTGEMIALDGGQHLARGLR